MNDSDIPLPIDRSVKDGETVLDVVSALKKNTQMSFLPAAEHVARRLAEQSIACRKVSVLWPGSDGCWSFTVDAESVQAVLAFEDEAPDFFAKQGIWIDHAGHDVTDHRCEVNLSVGYMYPTTTALALDQPATTAQRQTHIETVINEAKAALFS